MELIIQSPTRPERIVDALADMIQDDISEIRLSVSYISASGLNLLIERLRQRLGDNAWNGITKSLVTCVDYGITDPHALSLWMSLPSSAAFLQNAELLSGNSLAPITAFHAKMYEYRTPTNSNLMVGSANLSERALTSNSEVATVHVGVTDRKLLDSAWATLCAGASILDGAQIKTYETIRAKQAPPPPVPIHPPSTTLSLSLWDSIGSQSCEPSSFEYFWVDAGYLSGGSGNQLELPRGANRYFGFLFNNYHIKQMQIGQIDVSVMSVLHPGRQLSWHGDNKMERVNLPTGPSYGGNIMLFRRRPAHYELTWAPVGSERASIWANASGTVGHRYRVGQTGNRTCGLF